MTETLTLTYNLTELPSSQHRAGLAGLVFMVDWLKGEIEKDELDAETIICRRSELDETISVFEINQEGLQYLFDKVYAASKEDQERDKVIKNSRTKEVIPYKGEPIEKKILNEKTGKLEKKTYYIYPQIIPHGAFLVDLDKSEKGIWIKLWRDMIWGILYSRDKQRLPYKARAEKTTSKEADNYWKLLTKTPEKEVDLSSTQFIGAEGANADDVPFKDRVRFQFLLHFWAFVAQIYVPMTTEYDRKKKTEEVKFKGYALTIPDISNLKVFCAKLPNILQERGDKKLLYQPKESVVDLVAEGALDFMSKLNHRLSEGLIESRVSRVLLGIDVIHLEKQGNSIRVWSTNRINPADDTTDFETVKKAYFNHTFRKQRMLNVLNEKDWFYGFDSLLSKTDSERTIGNTLFRGDVRKAFEDIGVTNKLGGKVVNNTTETISKSLEKVVYDLVFTYIREKLRDKYQLEWSKMKNASESEKEDYNKLKGKIAREAFLAIRSRTDEDFIEYFTSVLCSYHQFSLKDGGFDLVAEALYDEEKRGKVRTLTMLALSANGYSPKSDNQGENQ